MRRYVLGRNELSRQVCASCEIDGVIDDYTNESYYVGVPVLRMRELPNDAVVVNCSLSISPVSAQKKLEQSAIRGCFYYCELSAIDGQAYPLPASSLGFRKELREHVENYEKLYGIMADEASKKTMLDIFRLRLSADPCCMHDYGVRVDEQYFEEFLKLEEGGSFADVGGFDGDTTEELLLRYPGYSKVHFFEPSLQNLNKAKHRLGSCEVISYYHTGVSNSAGEALLSGEGGPTCVFSDVGEERVEVNTLDNLLADPIDFIKMDIEGFELKALEGASRHIADPRTKLAIAAYHKPEDIRCICDFVLALRPHAKVYLRHYTEGVSESILFFV